MTIDTDAVIDFFGTQDDVSNTSSAVLDGSMSVSADTSDWTNDDDAPVAAVIFEATYATAPDANSTVSLYAQLMNIVGTDDADAPDTNNLHVHMGNFKLNDVTTRQHVPLDVDLPNTVTSQVYHFFVLNNAGQTLSAGWQLHITPKSPGPHP